MTTLQRLVLPTLDLCSEPEMYLRCWLGSWYSYASGEVRLQHGSTVRFDTYFNGFSVGKWRRHTTVDRVRAVVRAQGRIEISVGLHHPYRTTRMVAAAQFEADEPADLALPVLDLEELTEGQLFVEVRAIGDQAVVYGGRFETDAASAGDCRLGIVITTFNRPAYVRANLARLVRTLERHDEYAKRVEVLVVDNGSNLELDAELASEVTVLPNRNLGGSGGFARGLMHFREAARVSHVLFMDDDITFDPEIILRTCEFLSYGRDPHLCLAGAMLTEERPNIQFEAGAAFLAESIHPFRPIGSHIDLRWTENLVANDVERPAGYGAWWYFAFPLELGSVNPLPVFVRGDDVSFGLQRTGEHTTTMNGIGVWHQHFVYKNGPPAFYYESRNLPLVSALNSDRYSGVHLARRFVYQTTRTLLAMKYDSAEARIAGTREFLNGPKAWLAIDHEKCNEEIRAKGGERLVPLTPAQLAVPPFKPRTQLATRGGGALSALVLSGHLLPKRFSRRGPIGLEAAAWSPAAVFGREEVIYRYDPTGEGFVARRDRKRFFRLSLEMLRTAADAVRALPDLKREYRAAFPDLTSDEYWRRQFGKEQAHDQFPE